MTQDFKPAPVLVVTFAQTQTSSPFVDPALRVTSTELRIVLVREINESRAAAVSPLHNP